ncbi:hypothetical protein POSPLADRAFT_1038980 [Postia placenta MAD-698-R-SB12]|uniref:Ribosomal protein S21 n=1 Tax=Postia placenta MAD-698-R-SB12 TaxID=670580 RepID=A0A1X6N9L3_9APHY|nr:hypothetical protein POSPLADRAFT_1038980 [Postia placenta MAD-698-R-SB12]OSX65200.1 hypothetical protein POSPLADRAFT_1038980 [Postia placenta MAD-698-R-SB12]
MLASLVKQRASTALRTAARLPTVSSSFACRARLLSSSSQPESPDVRQSSPLKMDPLRSTTLERPRTQDRMWNYLLPTIKQVVDQDKSPEDVWKERGEAVSRYLSLPNTPYSGRSVSTYTGVAFAFTKLRRILSTNHVVKELRMAERHEKKGDKRRRLRSVRWRRRFAHEVRKKVQLVNEIRARGS